jgi:serine/threonine-protein kinase CHEK1
MHNMHSIVHRDLKPENLLLDKFGNLKIADFGTATLFKKNNVKRRLTSKCGTTLYMAPEIFNGSYDGPKAELWSVGIVLFVMLTGCHPWEDATSMNYKLFQSKDYHHSSPTWSRISEGCRGITPFPLIAIITRSF